MKLHLAPPAEPASADRVFPGHHLKCGSIQIPLWLRGVAYLSSGARLVYGTLVWAAGGRKAVFDHSVSQLAAVAGISERSFQRHLKELERRGLIRRAAPVGAEAHHRYHFLRHESMFMDEAILATRPYLGPEQAKTSHGYKVTREYVLGVISWIRRTRHETGWDDPRKTDDD